jgi:hypothetical protein
MPSRGLAFKKEEVNYLLEVMADILPISSMEWEDVERRHNEKYSTNERTKDTLKRKFQNLYLKRVPTGDPTIPPEVRWAKKIQNDIKQRADISEGEDTDGDDEADEEYDESQEGTEHDTQQDDVDDTVLLTPTVATAAARRPKSSSVFKAPMLRVGTRSQVDPFENVMKYIMKKDLELKIVKQEDDKRREREREERRNDEERRYQLMFMQAQQAQQQTNAILQHLVNISTGTTGTTQQQQTSYTNDVHQQDEMACDANNIQQQHTPTYESPLMNAVFSPPTATTDETKVSEEQTPPKIKSRRCMDDFPPEIE